MITNRHWLRQAALLPGLVLCLIMIAETGYTRGPKHAEGKLQVFFTGNIRGNVSPCGCHISKGGVIRLANYVENNQSADGNRLLIDAGNFVERGFSGLGCSEKCALMVASFATLGYDAVNIGGQELALGYATLKALGDTTVGIRFISANIVDAATGGLMFDPYVIMDFGSMSVGVIGLFSDAAVASVTGFDTSVMRVTSLQAAAEQYLGELGSKVNKIVVVGELADSEVRQIVAAYPQVDLVILSGSQRMAEVMRKIGGARVMSAGASGYNGHYVNMEYHAVWGDSFAFHDYMVTLTEEYDFAGELSEKLIALGVKSVPPMPEETE